LYPLSFSFFNPPPQTASAASRVCHDTHSHTGIMALSGLVLGWLWDSLAGWLVLVFCFLFFTLTEVSALSDWARLGLTLGGYFAAG
jgi:hypothetical protein